MNHRKITKRRNKKRRNLTKSDGPKKFDDCTATRPSPNVFKLLSQHVLTSANQSSPTLTHRFGGGDHNHDPPTLTTVQNHFH